MNDEEFDPHYSFTKKEVEQVKKWQKKHRKKNHPEGNTYQGAVGVERFKWEIYATSIGMVRRCFCESCEKKYFEEEKIIDPPTKMEEIFSMTEKEKEKRKKESKKAREELKKKWDYECDFSDF